MARRRRNAPRPPPVTNAVRLLFCVSCFAFLYFLCLILACAFLQCIFFYELCHFLFVPQLLLSCYVMTVNNVHSKSQNAASGGDTNVDTYFSVLCHEVSSENTPLSLLLKSMKWRKKSR
jgi:hypothetical protein